MYQYQMIHIPLFVYMSMLVEVHQDGLECILCRSDHYQQNISGYIQTQMMVST